jgi:outer membrane protein assembly factor BamB
VTIDMPKRTLPRLSHARHSSLVTRRFPALARIVFLSFLLCFMTSSFSLLQAEHTRRWLQTTYEEFLKGTPHGVAVRSDGRLELAPKFTLLADADASYLWSLRVDPKGALYAGGGSPAKVFRFDNGGTPTTVFESTDLVAQSIAFDAKGMLYVATSPDGKVYRVSASGEKSVFFDPKTKYIWDLAFGSDGVLYVATGDKGQVFAVSPDGKSELFYASDEAHIRALAFDANKNLLAGTEPNGRVLRITRPDTKSPRKDKGSSAVTAEGFVLYETSKREVTSFAVAPDGSMYVAAIGEKQRTISTPSTTIVTSPQGTTTFTSSVGGVTGTVSGQLQQATPFVAFPPILSSSIYRLSPEGAPDELWTSRDDVVYSLGFASDGRVLAGTGNNGALLAIDGHGVFAQLAKAGSAQITGIARNAAGKVFLCTANPGKVFSVGPEYEPEGTFESRSFDAQLFSQWGHLDWWGPQPAPAIFTSAKSSANSREPRLEFFVRSGNTEDPGKEWSRWFGPYSKPGSAVEAPPARFLQWKAVIHDGRPGDGINWVNVAYLPRNVAPVIDAIVLEDPGVRAQSITIISSGQSPSVVLKMPPTPNTPNIFIAQTITPPKFEQPPQGLREKGYQSVLWSAHDDNDDELRYSVYYRGENEHAWKLLKDKLEQKFYSWDTTTLADGAYYLKIVATDSASNPPAIALETEREGERFEVDNTPPVIEHLDANPTMPPNANSSASVIVKFTARDTVSSIDRSQYSLDGSDWTLLAPAGNVSDSTVENYEFTLNHLTAGEHTIAVRAYDRFENVGAAKIAVSINAVKNPAKQ